MARVRMAKYYDKIEAMKDALSELAEKLEWKKEEIEDRAISLDREMTDSEQERYDDLENQISGIYDCIYDLDSAMDDIVDYC